MTTTAQQTKRSFQSSSAPTKYCHTCGRLLPNTTEFFYGSASRAALSSKCIDCDREYKRQHYAANLEMFRAIKRRDWPKYREAQREYRARVKAEKPEHVALLYRLKHDRAHPAALIRRRNRRALYRGSEGRHTRADIHWLTEHQCYRCYFCEAPLMAGDTHVDHLVPLSRGGSNWPDNLAITCGSCNERKHTDTADEFVIKMQQRIANGGVSWWPCW